MSEDIASSLFTEFEDPRTGNGSVNVKVGVCWL